MILELNRLKILVIFIGVGLISLVWHLIIRGKLRPVYGILWMIVSCLFLLAILIPGVVTGLARFLQIEYTPSLIFALGLLFVIGLLLFQTVVISNLTKKNTDLAQRFSILNWQVEHLITRMNQFVDISEKDGNIFSQTSLSSEIKSAKVALTKEPEIDQTESTNSDFPLQDRPDNRKIGDNGFPDKHEQLPQIQENLLNVGDGKE
jgi:hypothetical protein